MVQILQLRRNTTTELSSERGSIGEIIIDTTKKVAVVMDGVTNGGTPLAKESDIPTKVSDLANDAGYITSASVFSGSYNDLTDTPTLFSGSYADLTDKPTLFSGDYADLTGKPTLFDGQYSSLTGAPTLFDGQYSSLTGVPTSFAPSAHTQDFSTITNTPTSLSGYGIQDSVVIQGGPEIQVGNTHLISSVDDLTMRFGPNSATVYFGTALQNWFQIQNVNNILLSPDTALTIGLPDESVWSFGLGGGLDFPDATTQTTAWTGEAPYTDGTSTGVWATPAPTTVSEAIDRIATALYTLGANTAI